MRRPRYRRHRYDIITGEHLRVDREQIRQAVEQRRGRLILAGWMAFVFTVIGIAIMLRLGGLL